MTSPTPSSVDVAQAILGHTEIKKMTKKKLHKLSYYVQGWALAVLQQPAFASQIFAWSDGPVVSELRYKTRGQSCRDILISAPSVSSIDPDLQKIIQLVVAEYGDKSEEELISMTREELPWQIARAELSDEAYSRNLIPNEVLQSFFSRSGLLLGLSADELFILGLDALFGDYEDDFDFDSALDYYLEHSDYDPVLDESANLFVIPNRE